MKESSTPAQRRRRALSRTTSALAAASLTWSVCAQESDESDPAIEETAEERALEEIIVVGFRKSLADALSIKQGASNIVDGINAEDIGKSADQNIAEALQRVTGISIDRANGEGTTVTVRGVDANLNNVTLNGVTVTNGAGDVAGLNSGQAVDFSAFSSDILQRIEVAKTASADHNEGSLGATIRLTTFRPLDVRQDRRVFDIQARYSEFADESLDVGDDIFGGDYRINAALSQKFAEDSVGVSLVATSEKTSGRSDAMEVRFWEPLAFIADPFSNDAGTLPGGITNLQTGQIEFNGPNAEDAIRFLTPNEVSYDQNFFSTQRHNVTGTFQWQPRETTDITLDATFTRVNRDNETTRLAIRPSSFPIREGATNAYDPVTASIVNYRLTANGFGPGNARNPGFVRPQTTIDKTNEETFVLGFDVEQRLGDFTLNLSGGHSDSTGRDDDFINGQGQLVNFNTMLVNTFNGNGPRPGFTRGFDCPPNQPCVLVVDDSVPNRTEEGTNNANPNVAIIDDPNEFIVGFVGSRDRRIDDENQSVFFDVDWERQFGPITSFEVGTKWDRRHRVQEQTNTGLSRFSFEPNAFAIEPFVASLPGLRDGFGSRIDLPRDSVTDGIVVYNPLLARDALQQQNPNAGVTRPVLQNFRDIELTVYGGYAKANFEMMDGRIFGDFGLRWVDTDVDTAGGATAEPAFTNFNNPENRAFFGYFGEGDPNNTATLAEAEARIFSLFGPDLLNTNDPGFVAVQGTPAAASNNYDNWLPSLNINFLAREDLLVRFAASRTMARPNLDRLRPNLFVRENTFFTTSGNAGNPFLKPFTSDNLDLSVEWYFNENSLFSVALFNKYLKDAEREITQVVYMRDPRIDFFDANGAFIDDPSVTGPISQNSFILPFTPDNQPIDICLPERVLDLNSSNFSGPDDPLLVRSCAPVQFRRPVNSGDAYVRGVELSFQHNLTYLPGWLSGFGVVANYTYADSEVDAQIIDDGLGNIEQFRAAPLPNTSNHTFNTTVFYERGRLQLRAAYNDRSDFLRSTASIPGGTRIYTEGFDTLDLSAGFDITDNLSLTFQAVNVLDTVRRDYAVVELDPGTGGAGAPIPEEPLTLGDQPTHRTHLQQNTGRIFRLGLRWNF